MPNTSPPVHVIVRLPYNRPEDAVDPPVVEWSAEQEAYLWDIISRSRGPAGSGTDWQGLSERLKVPLPFLMYRAQVRYEEDLRGLQAAMAEPITQPTAQPLAIPSPLRQEDKISHMTPPNVSSVGIRTSTASTPRQATPIGVRNRFTSHLRSPPALHSSHGSTSGTVSASTVTLTHRPAAAMPGHSPTHLRPISPPESRSASETEDEGERQDEIDDPEAIRKRLKDLERMMTSNVLGFARVKPTLKAPDPSSSVIRTSPCNDTASGGETTSAQSSIPSIPSPPESQLQPPQHMPQHNPPGSSQTGRRLQQSRSPPQSPPQQVVRNKMVGKQPLPKGSNHGSSASSFSDISDASISTSALDDALNSNLRQPTGSSRFPTFTRPHFTRIAHHTQPQ